MIKVNNEITVIVPCYNYGRFLEQALNSLFKQSKIPKEIIIADDCSTDNTEKISKKYSEKYPENIFYYKNKKNLGIIKNFNKAVLKAKGDYICFLGADNRFKKTYLEKTSSILDNNPKIGIVYTDFELFGERAKEVYESFNPEYKGKVDKKNNKYEINFPDFNQKTKEIQKTQNFIHGSSMYRKSAFKKVGGYKKNGLKPEDQNLFTRIIENGWLAKRIPQPLLEYRQHSEDQANIKLQNQAIISQLKNTIFDLELTNKQLLEDLNNIKSENKQIKKILFKIQSSKTYKLWQKYNKIKKIFKK